jgi:hypothetical protein
LAVRSAATARAPDSAAGPAHARVGDRAVEHREHAHQDTNENDGSDQRTRRAISAPKGSFSTKTLTKAPAPRRATAAKKITPPSVITVQ